MDDDIVDCATMSVDNVDTLDPEVRSAELLEAISPNREVLRESATGESLARIELDIACSSEKLDNLNVLMVLVAAKESDFESFAPEADHASDDSVERAIEFELLAGFLDSEVRELDNCVADIQSEIVDAREMISSCENLGDAFVKMEEKLHNSEESLKQSQDQISEIKVQSTEFQRTLLSYGEEENRNGEKEAGVSQNGRNSDVYAKIKMQTAEQQRRILRTLEKSLARELDLEKRLSESRMGEDELRLRLESSENEVFCLEEEIAVAWGKLFEADSAEVVLKGILKELIGRLQVSHFNLKDSTQREIELNWQLQSCMGRLKAKEIALKKLESSSAELRHSILELNNRIKANGSTSEKVASLERQLRESDMQLQHAVASAEASQERQSMLYSTIGDMNNLIENMKMKVSKAERQVESAEDRCIILSESNADLNDELSFLRSRVESVESSLHKTEGRRVETAKGINIRTKIITDLVMQLVVERERLYKQVSSLTEDNSVLVEKLQQRNKDPSIFTRQHHDVNGREYFSPGHDFTSTTTAACVKESKQVEFSTPKVEDDKRVETASVAEAVDRTPDLSTVRTIDAQLLNFKHLFVAVLILLISMTVYLFQQEGCPF